MPIYTWLDPQRTSYGFGYGSFWSLAGLIYAPSRGRPLRHLIFVAGYTVGGVVVIIIAHLQWGSSSHHYSS